MGANLKSDCTTIGVMPHILSNCLQCFHNHPHNQLSKGNNQDNINKSFFPHFPHPSLMSEGWSITSPQPVIFMNDCQVLSTPPPFLRLSLSLGVRSASGWMGISTMVVAGSARPSTMPFSQERRTLWWKTWKSGDSSCDETTWLPAVSEPDVYKRSPIFKGISKRQYSCTRVKVVPLLFTFLRGRRCGCLQTRSPFLFMRFSCQIVPLKWLHRFILLVLCHGRENP